MRLIIIGYSRLSALLVCFVLGLSAAAFAQTDKPTTGDDIWPWPWSSQCPFNWSNFEGRWDNPQDDNRYFSFELISEDNIGGHYFNIAVKHVDGGTIMEGSGYASAESQLVHVAVGGFDQEGDWYTMWLTVGLYTRDLQGVCSQGNFVMVMKLGSGDSLSTPQEIFTIERRPTAIPPEPPINSEN